MELRPVVLQNCTLERIGSVYDGGYLMCGNLLGRIQSACTLMASARPTIGAVRSRSATASPVPSVRLFQPAAGGVRRRPDGIPQRVHRSEAGK